MAKLFHAVLCESRKRRSFAVDAALRLLRAVHSSEYDDMCRFSDMLDDLCLSPQNAPTLIYEDVELRCIASENSLSFLDSAIEDLGFAYRGRF